MGQHRNFQDRLFGSSDMIWDAFAYKRDGVARTRGDARAQRFATTTVDEIDEGRERILDVAEKLIRRFGHPKTTMANIAWELGTSRATLYRYFPTKEALEEQVCARVASRTLRQVRNAVAEQNQASAQLMTLFAELGRETSSRIALEPHLHHLFAEAFRNRWQVAPEYLREVNDLVEDIVVKGQAAGAFVPVHSAKMTKFVVISMLIFVHPAMAELLGFDDGELPVDLTTHVETIVGSIARESP